MRLDPESFLAGTEMVWEGMLEKSISRPPVNSIVRVRVGVKGVDDGLDIVRWLLCPGG